MSKEKQIKQHQSNSGSIFYYDTGIKKLQMKNECRMLQNKHVARVMDYWHHYFHVIPCIDITNFKDSLGVECFCKY